MNTPIIITFVIYLAIILFVGFIANRMTKDLSDFVLAGRRLSSSFVALGAGASDMGGWLLLGLPGAAYTLGINQLWLPIGLSIGAFLNWHYISKRLRVYTVIAKDSLTIPSFLGNRLHDKSRILSLVTAFVILFFFTTYAAAGFVSGALLFHSFTPLSYNMALLIGAVFIMTYVCVGGFLAVNWVDFFQGTLMFIALIILPVSVIIELGGWGQAVSQTYQLNPLHLDAFSGISTIGIISLLSWGLGYFGQPHILVRFMAIKNQHDLPKAKLICMSWMILSLYGAVFIGLFGYAYFANQPLASPESVTLKLSMILFKPWIAGFFLAAVLSAIMSTIAAQLLVSSSALTEDFYHRFLRKKASQKELVWVSRITIVIIAVIALAIASHPESNVLYIVSYAWGGMGASFGPLIILSLFWKHTSRTGAIAGILSGSLTAIIWELLRPYGGLFELYALLPGFIISFVTIIIVSLLGKPVSEEIKKEYQQMLDEERA